MSTRGMSNRTEIGKLLIVGALCWCGEVEAQGTRNFINPKVEGLRLDYCLTWGQQCGDPAADAWCRMNMGKAGGRLKSWEVDPDIGARAPTYVLRDRKICNQDFCDGFKRITCEYGLE